MTVWQAFESVTGRKKEGIVLSSGQNIDPEEIEARYRQSAFIKEICILGSRATIKPLQNDCSPS